MRHKVDTPRVVGPGFYNRVYEQVAKIPKGRVATYGDVAASLGAKEVARHVGFALAALPPSRKDVPWHRVVNGRGRLTSPSAEGEQAWRLQKEGVRVEPDGRIGEFSRIRYTFTD